MHINPGAILFVLFSMAFFLVGIYMVFSEVLIQKTWQQIHANVESSYVESDYDPDGSYYWPVIEYSYRYNGKNYEGSCCQNSFFDNDEAEEFVTNTIGNERIEIYINPNNPSESRLKDDLHPFNIANMVVLAIGALLTISSLVHLYGQSEF
ncbi:MAG: DUF3592 domain-containing protein [Candidatus Micrarchaeota archaeon]